jgi:hypothetical protein
MFFAEINEEFMLGLNVQLAYHASVDLERHILRLGQEEVRLWNSGVDQLHHGFLCSATRCTGSM